MIEKSQKNYSFYSTFALRHDNELTDEIKGIVRVLYKTKISTIHLGRRQKYFHKLKEQKKTSVIRSGVRTPYNNEGSH